MSRRAERRERTPQRATRDHPLMGRIIHDGTTARRKRRAAAKRKRQKASSLKGANDEDR